MRAGALEGSPRGARTVRRLEELGWVLPEASGSGVRHCCSAEAEISFPSAAYEAGESVAAGSGFYLRHRVESVLDLLSAMGIDSLLEIGAGNGNMAVPLVQAGLEVIAVEPLRSGADASARAGVTSVCGTLADLGLPDASLPAVGMFDVLEHLEDPRGLLREVHRVLEPRGVLAITVPAASWLWSDLDTALGHFRRYGKRSLLDEIVPVGFRPLVLEHLFACLVPAAAILRALPYRLGHRRSESDVLDEVKRELAPPPAVQAAAGLLLGIERVVSSFVPLPCGLSLLAGFEKTERKDDRR